MSRFRLLILVTFSLVEVFMRRFFIWTIRLLLSLLIALAALEVIVRVANLFGDPPSSAESKAQREELLESLTGSKDAADDGHAYENQLELHPFFGYVHNETFGGINRAGFQSPYEFEIVPEGYRFGPLRESSKPPLVVGIFGGSFAQYVGWNSQAMEEALAKAYPEREPYVITMAVGGHALPQSGYIYQYYANLFDVVIFIDGLNELWNPVENNKAGLPPVFAKAVHYQYKLSLAELSQERLMMTQRLIELKEKRVAWARRSLQGITGASMACRKLAQGLEARWSNETNALERDLKEGYLEGDPYTDWSMEDSFAFTAQQWQTWHQRIDRETKARGALFLHYLQPNPHVEGSKRVLLPSEEHAMHHTFAIEQYVVEGYPYLRRVMEDTRSTDNPIRDLTGIYRDVETEIWWDAAHPTEEGQLIIQRFLSDEISEALRNR